MPSLYQLALNELTLDQLYREFANTVDSMQGMRVARVSSDRIYKHSKLTIIQNEIRKREAE